MGKNLVPLSKSAAKQLGIVNTKQGWMVNKSKLVDKKKYQSKEKSPENKIIRKKPEVKAKEKADQTKQVTGQAGKEG